MTFSATTALSFTGFNYPTEPPEQDVSVDAWSRTFEPELSNQSRMIDCARRHLAPGVLFRPWFAPAPKKEKRRPLAWDALEDVDEIEKSARAR